MNRDASNLSTGSAPFELVFWGQISDFPDGSVEHAGWFTRTSRIGLVCTSLGRWCLAPSRAVRVSIGPSAQTLSCFPLWFFPCIVRIGRLSESQRDGSGHPLQQSCRSPRRGVRADGAGFFSSLAPPWGGSGSPPLFRKLSTVKVSLTNFDLANMLRRKLLRHFSALIFPQNCGKVCGLSGWSFS